jgi:hypothetical protein
MSYRGQQIVARVLEGYFSTLLADIDFDNDIDGKDVAGFIENSKGLSIGAFASVFGSAACQ